MPQDFTVDESTLVQVMAWCHQATSHYLGQCWPRSILPYGVTRLQWVNSVVKSVTGTILYNMYHIAAIFCGFMFSGQVTPYAGLLANSEAFLIMVDSNELWNHRTWSTLDQVMACCLTAPSLYLNYHWLIISLVATFTWRSSKDIIKISILEVIKLKITAPSPWSQCVIHCGLVTPYGNISLGHHGQCHAASWHQAITWTSVDLSLGFCAIHLKAIALEMIIKMITIMHLKITHLNHSRTQSSRGQ